MRHFNGYKGMGKMTKVLRTFETSWTDREEINEVHNNNWEDPNVDPDDDGMNPEDEIVITPPGFITSQVVITNEDSYGCRKAPSLEVLEWLNREQERNKNMKLAMVEMKVGKLHVKCQAPQPRSQSFHSHKQTTEAKEITVHEESKKRKLDIDVTTEETDTTHGGNVIPFRMDANILGTGGSVVECRFNSSMNGNIINVPSTTGKINEHTTIGSITMDPEFALQVPETTTSSEGRTKTYASTNNDVMIYLLRGMKTDTFPPRIYKACNCQTLSNCYHTLEQFRFGVDRPTYIWEEPECEKYDSHGRANFIHTSAFKPYFRNFHPGDGETNNKVEAFKINGSYAYTLKDFEELLSDDKLVLDKFVYLIENHNRLPYDNDLKPGTILEPSASVTVQFKYSFTVELSYWDPTE